MSLFYELDPPSEDAEPQLPPLLKSEVVKDDQDPFSKAIVAATAGDIGTVFYSPKNDFLNFAVTLGPEIEREKALQVHYVMMLGCSDALGALAPPEIDISHLWPNLIFLNRGLMGKILLMDPGGEKNKIPSWLVSGVQMRLKVETKFLDERLEGTSLEDEGGSYLSRIRLIEAISRHFLVWLNTWQEEGFKPIHQKWMERVEKKISLPNLPDGSQQEWVGLDENGLAIFKKDEKHNLFSLEKANISK